MSIDEIIAYVTDLGEVLTQRPQAGDGTPEAAWGDVFFFHAADGATPSAAQPFATIVTKDLPGDTASRLDRPGAFRLSVAAGRDAFVRWTGRDPRDPAPGGAGPAADDTVQAHPVYGRAGWLAVVNPGEHTSDVVRDLLRTAHGLARARHRRRADAGPR
jgi:hypothetical protein